MAEMVPELINKDEVLYPHEHVNYLSNEPHFRRVWQHYREYQLQMRFQQLVNDGQISEQDADNAT